MSPPALLHGFALSPPFIQHYDVISLSSRAAGDMDRIRHTTPRVPAKGPKNIFQLFFFFRKICVTIVPKRDTPSRQIT